MDIDFIRCFVLSAEALSFSEAASRMYLSPSTVSRRITTLEEDLGIPLFVRSKSSLALTPEGKMVLPDMQEVVRRWDAIHSRIQQDMKGTYAINIACMGQHYADILRESARRITEHFPNINVSVDRIHSPAAINALKRGDIDLLLCVECELDRDPRIEFVPFRKATYDVLCLPDHRFASMTSVPVIELANEHLFAWEAQRSPMVFKRITDAFANAHIQPVITVRPSILPEVVWPVVAGKGVSIYTADCLDGMPPELVHIPIDGIPPITIGLARMKNNRNVMLKNAMNILESVFKDKA